MTHLVICVQFSKTFWQVSKLFPPRTLYSAFNDGYLVQGKICVISATCIPSTTRYSWELKEEFLIQAQKDWNVFDICFVLVRSVWWGRVSGDECTEGKFDVPGGPGHDTTDNGDTVVTSSHRGGKRGIGDNTDTTLTILTHLITETCSRALHWQPWHGGSLLWG